EFRRVLFRSALGHHSTRRSRYRLRVRCQAKAPCLEASDSIRLNDALAPRLLIISRSCLVVDSLRGGDRGSYAYVDINTALTKKSSVERAIPRAHVHRRV